MQSEDTYDNMYDEQVTWTFRKVLHVFELDDTPFETGKELYARFLHVKKNKAVDTVVQPMYDIGAVAMRLLTKYMNKEKVEDHTVILPHRIQFRDSTK